MGVDAGVMGAPWGVLKVQGGAIREPGKHQGGILGVLWGLMGVS